MDTGQRIARVEASRKHLSDQIVLKFSGPQLVNNFSIHLETSFGPYRQTCLETVLADLASQQSTAVLTALWEMHTRIRAKFVQALSKLSPHAHQPPSKPYRDTAREFLVFIKSGQSGYNTLLRTIHDFCPDVSILRNIAGPYLEGQSAGAASYSNQPRPMSSDEVKHAVTTITRNSLIYLGDLSRWRHKAHVDRSTQAPAWKKARHYYGLAHEVDPSSGLAKHQLAVLAQDDGKYFPALASLYQSLVSADPHPQAANNLDVLMLKRLAVPMNQIILKVKPSEENGNGVAMLRAWFLQLHVKFYRGQLFEKHAEMETEVLSRLSQALRDNTNLDGTLLSMTLINTAAEYVALDQAKQGVRAQENAQMYFFCFRHNVKTFRTLLDRLHEALEAQSHASVAAQADKAQVPPVSSVAMQSIRLYILWFSVNWPFMQKCMEENTPDASVAAEIRQLWVTLADVLNAIYEQYPLFEVQAVGDCEFLVDEEEATMGFLPVHSPVNEDIWTRNGAMKPVLRRERSASEQKALHLVRLRDIYTRALLVANDQNSSLIIAGEKVIFNESGTTSELFSPPNHSQEPEPVTPPPTGTIDPAVYPATGTLAEDAQTFDVNYPERKILMRRASKSPIHVLPVVDPAYDFPTPLPWIPERFQDEIWHPEHWSVKNKTPWGGIPFGAAWYSLNV